MPDRHGDSESKSQSCKNDGNKDEPSEEDGHECVRGGDIDGVGEDVYASVEDVGGIVCHGGDGVLTSIAVDGLLYGGSGGDGEETERSG